MILETAFMAQYFCSGESDRHIRHRADLNNRTQTSLFESFGVLHYFFSVLFINPANNPPEPPGPFTSS